MMMIEDNHLAQNNLVYYTTSCGLEINELYVVIEVEGDSITAIITHFKLARQKFKGPMNKLSSGHQLIY